jgi:hypothetical protein
MKTRLLICVVLAAQATLAWSFDQGALARDREAILAMTGEYHVDFDFRETVALRPGYELTEPYRTGGTEFVAVVEDRGDFISLQHILVMENEDTGEAVVVKHWRQDWQYEPNEVLAFEGKRRWTQLPVGVEAARGAWSQTVWQVDDSPRYAGVGRWVHDGGFSAWTSNRGWRPLPRREYTKRDDYDVMVATNRHVITPTGWVHEQDNSKLDLDDPASPYIAHEVGVNTYTRIDDHDFSAGYAYWQQTGPFWAAVRAWWEATLERRDSVVLAGDVGGDELVEAIFDLADRLTGDAPEPLDRVVAEMSETMNRFLVSAPTTEVPTRSVAATDDY